MNESYQILASLNSNINKKNPYSTNDSIQKQRSLLFDVVKTNKAVGKVQRVHRGSVNSPHFNFEGQVGNYTQAQALDKIKTLKNVIKDGSIYTFDFETLGKSVFQNGDVVTEADKLNNSIFTATEFAISKQVYKNGKPVGEPVKVINFTSSPDAKDLRMYINKALTNKNQDSTTVSTLSRIAGYSNPDNFGIDKETGKVIPTGWINNAKINDSVTIGAGVTNLVENMQYKVGTPEYKKAVGEIYSVIEDILNDKNSVLTSFNGNVFDIPVMVGLFKDAGINVGDNFEELIMNNSLDTQQLFRNFIKSDIFNLQTNASKAGVDVVESLSVENLIHAANSLGAGIDTTLDAHVALTDTVNESKILSTFLDSLFEASDKVEKDIENRKIPFTSKSLFHANNAVMANDNDIFFIDGGYSTPNTYNKALMEPGHSYRLSVYDINKKELPDELKKQIKDFQDKKIIKMEDIYDGYTRNSYLLTNSSKDIQERLLNDGGVIVLNDTKEAVETLNKSTEIAFKNKAMQTKDNFFNVNSDKGYKDFKMYLDMFSEYTENDIFTKAELSQQIKAMSNPNGDKTVNEALKNLFSRGGKGQLVHERAFNLLNLYDDFNMNKDLYSTMLNAVDYAVNNSEFLLSSNLGNDSNSKNLINRIRTSALASAKEELYNIALNSIDDDTALNYIIDNNSNLSLLINSRIEKAKKELLGTGKDFTKSAEDEIKKEAFKLYYGEDYSKNSQTVRNNIFGMVEVSGTVKEFEGIDILNTNGEYTRIQINDKNNFINKLKMQVNAGVKSENRSPQVSERMRKIYLKNVVDDLSKRGLIGSDVVDQFNNTSTVQGMIDLIGKNVYDTKAKFDELVKLDAHIDYEKMSEDEFKFVRNYINNHNMRRIYTEGKGFTIMGEPAEKFLMRRYPNLQDTLVDSANKAIPSFMTYTLSASKNESNEKIIKDLLKDNFGWSDSNVDNFMKKIINSSELSTFQYATSGKKTNGLSHHIVLQDNKGYLISTPFDKEAAVASKIARGLNVGEINNLATIWEIPKVENYGAVDGHAGIPIIKQGNGDISYKAVTKDIRLQYVVDDQSGHFIPKLTTEDTVDQVINSLEWNYKDAKRLMEEGAFEAANRKLGRSWKRIHENKTLSSVVTRPTKEYGIIKEVGLSRADYALPGMVNISDLVYTVDSIIENKDLRKSFYEDVVDPDYILEQVKGYKAQLHSRGNLKLNKKYSKKGFDEWNKSFQLWFADNISNVAQEILNNEAFVENNDDLVSILRSIKNTGREGFFGKESGDANRGFFFINPPKNYVAGSRFSGTSRPLLNQVMSAQNVYSEDMIYFADRVSSNIKRKSKRSAPTVFDNIASKEDLYKYVGINIGHGYMTSDAVEYANISKKLGKGEIGYTLKTKLMSSGEFLDKINKLATIDEAGLESLMSDKIFINAIENAGINKGIINEEYIRKVARNIASATNLYEDSSLISPFVSTLMSPKTITSLSFDEASTKKSNLGIGDKITPGTVIKSVDGKVKVSDKNAGTIVGRKNGKLFIQLDNEYYNMKGGFGSEKTQMITPFFNDYDEMSLTDAIIKHISGGASAIINPSLIKHESFNSIMSGYANAIGYGISSEEDLNYVNKSLKEFIPGLNMEYKNIDGRYVLVEGDKTGSVSFEDFENFINHMEENGNSNISQRIKEVKSNSIADLDFVGMQDNTIQGYNSSVNIGKGAAINYRSQSVMGIFIGDGEIDELGKYRKISNGKVANLWDELIKSDIEQLASDPKFIRAQEQVQNIKVALASSVGEGMENVNIQKFDLSNGAVGSSIMQAEELPDIFKYDPEKRIHAYEIDLSDLNIKINNFIYDDLKSKNLEIVHSHILPNVEKIYIPALDANYMDEGYTLTMTQRKAADLINSLNDFRNSKFEGKSITEASNNLYIKYKEYIEALRYDLVDGHGLNKSSMKIKSKFSSRLKVANVAAPISEEGGFKYKDLNFRDTSTVTVGGKEKYYGSIFISPKDFKKQGLNFKDVGMQLLEDNIGEESKVLNIIKKNVMDDIPEIIKAKNISQAKEILEGYEVSGKVYSKMGIDFLEEVGIHGVIMRDPAMKPTSYQVGIIRMRNLTSSTVSMDAVMADAMNADVDGDEINLFFRSLFEEDGKVKIKNLDDKEVSSMIDIMEAYSDHNLNTYYKLIEKNAQKEFTGLDIQKYIDEIGRDIGDVDNFNNEKRFSAFLSRFTKSTIGQISNPNYYLRTAATNYYANMPYDVSSYKKMSGILTLTDMAEQNLIDVKSIKTSEQSRKIATLASNYRSAIDDMANVTNKSKRENAIRTLYKSLMPLADENGALTLGYKLSDTGLHGDMEEQIEEAIQRILKGNIRTSTNGNSFTLEEALFYIKEVLEDQESRQVFFSQSIRQSDLKSVNGKNITELERVQRALHQKINENDELMSLVHSDNYLHSLPYLNGKYVNVGDNLYSLTDNGYIDEGVYKVLSVNRDGANNFIELKNTNTKQVTRINGKSFKSISNKISDMDYYSGEGFVDKLTNKYIAESASSLKGYNKMQSIISSKIETDFKFKAATSALETYNLDDLKDMLGTIEVLKNKGFVSSDDSDLFIKNMNEAIRKNGTIEYRKAKVDNLLKLKSLRKNTKVSSTSSVISLLNNEVTQDAINEAVNKSKVSSLIDDISKLARYNYDETSKDILSIIDDTIKSNDDFAKLNLEQINYIKSKAITNTMDLLSEADKEKIRELKKIFSEHTDDLDFITNILGLKLDEIDELIKNNHTSQAIDMINNAKIAFGDHIGFNIGQLEDDVLSKIISSEYDTSGISNEVVSRTKGIILKVQELKENGYIRPVSVAKDSNISSSSIVEDMVKDINYKIKNRGSIGKTDKIKGKSILDKISEVTSKVKNNKKVVYSSIAAIGAVLAGSYMYGNAKMKEKEGQYVSKNTNEYNNSNAVKVNESGTNTRGRYTEVPSSNMGYYGNNNGMTVNVKAKAPLGSNGNDLNKTLSKIFGGSGISVNTHMSDTRRTIEDRDVDEIMSMATRY